jgi:hypothetical protein
MSLVSSNSPNFAESTVRDAINLYRESADRSKALDILTKLKGIGPATASLLLTVHDPEQIIFFSDEAFYWLCLSGKKGPIKYNAKEYTALQSKASELSKRLGTSATDIEKVAYVLMRYPAEDPAASAETNMSSETIVKASAPKRKAATDVVTQSNVASARRSKRTRA